MNDYHLTHLADDRYATLRAEADRQRLARSAQPVPAPSGRFKIGRSRRLALLFGRAAA